jgi:tRNA(Leu) C34 or U34 (ribose-2'-O)-methylase TrmL
VRDDLDVALYTEDQLTRDAARRRLAEGAKPTIIAALIALLDAPHKLTRRRASRILGDMRPEAVLHPLSTVLADTEAPTRRRVACARLIAVVAPQGAAVLGTQLTDPETRIRRACVTMATDHAGLIRALSDADPEVAERAAAVLADRDLDAPVELLRDGGPNARRLLARLAPTDSALIAAADAGQPDAFDTLADAAALQRGLDGPNAVAAAWGLTRIGADVSALQTAADPRLRAAAARAGHVDDDPDPGVAWLARQARAGRYTAEALDARMGRHARLDSISAQPPFGIRPDDAVPDTTRVCAALALCQLRFDINLGVAVRSAEAAGFQEVFLLGRAGLFRSPARGTDHLLPIRHAVDAAALVRLAREAGYQIVAVQQTPDSVPYHTADYPPRPLFVMGAEDLGVPAPLRRAADLVVEIPQYGVIDSLNVAAAATVVMFHWRVHHGG